jgi:hypothetical protein
VQVGLKYSGRTEDCRKPARVACTAVFLADARGNLQESMGSPSLRCYASRSGLQLPGSRFHWLPMQWRIQHAKVKSFSFSGKTSD